MLFKCKIQFLYSILVKKWLKHEYKKYILHFILNIGMESVVHMCLIDTYTFILYNSYKNVNGAETNTQRSR